MNKDLFLGFKSVISFPLWTLGQVMLVYSVVVSWIQPQFELQCSVAQSLEGLCAILLFGFVAEMEHTKLIQLKQIHARLLSFLCAV